MFAFLSAGYLNAQRLDYPIEFALINNSSSIPQNLATTRSAIMISSSNKSDKWKEDAKAIHNQLTRMKVDPVLYVHYWDYRSSPVVTNKFQELMRTRNVNFIFLFHLDERVRLSIIPLTNGKFDFKKSSWTAEDNTINQVIFKLAIEQRKIDSPSTNFLVPDRPEVLEDITIFTGQQIPSYPSQVERRQMAVVLLPELTHESDIPSVQKEVENHNQQIRSINESIKSVMADYPYPHEFLPFDSDVNIAKKRFQYALRFIHTSGLTAKKLLNYSVEADETDFVSIVPLPDGERTLKTYPIEDPVYKFYIQQTIVFDCHVGRYWDADESLEQALRNFLLNMENQFNKRR